MNRLQSVSRLAVTTVRQMHLSPVSQCQPQYDNSHLPKMREIQKKFQTNDDVPVYLKGGPMDKVLFYITAGLCAVGTGLALRFIFVASYPDKNDSE